MPNNHKNLGWATCSLGAGIRLSRTWGWKPLPPRWKISSHYQSDRCSLFNKLNVPACFGQISHTTAIKVHYRQSKPARQQSTFQHHFVELLLMTPVWIFGNLPAGQDFILQNPVSSACKLATAAGLHWYLRVLCLQRKPAPDHSSASNCSVLEWPSPDRHSHRDF